MKMLFALLLCPFLSFAQSKGDTKIIITAPDSTGLFNKVAMVFYGKGYSLAQKDEQLHYMASNEKPIKYANVKVNALVKGNEVTLSGFFDATFFKLVSFEPIVYKNHKLDKFIFSELQAIADAIGGNIRYGK
jgi:hypothetical protein